MAIARSDININPLLAQYEEDRIFGYECFRGKHVFPIGEAVVGHSFVVIEASGKVYLVMDEVRYVADSFDEALENLLIRQSR